MYLLSVLSLKLPLWTLLWVGLEAAVVATATAFLGVEASASILPVLLSLPLTGRGHHEKNMICPSGTLGWPSLPSLGQPALSNFW